MYIYEAICSYIYAGVCVCVCVCVCVSVWVFAHARAHALKSTAKYTVIKQT